MKIILEKMSRVVDIFVEHHLLSLRQALNSLLKKSGGGVYV